MNPQRATFVVLVILWMIGTVIAHLLNKWVPFL
jgi:hypothetical protein